MSLFTTKYTPVFGKRRLTSVYDTETPDYMGVVSYDPEHTTRGGTTIEIFRRFLTSDEYVWRPTGIVKSFNYNYGYLDFPKAVQEAKLQIRFPDTQIEYISIAIQKCYRGEGNQYIRLVGYDWVINHCVHNGNSYYQCHTVEFGIQVDGRDELHATIIGAAKAVGLEIYSIWNTSVHGHDSINFKMDKEQQ